MNNSSSQESEYRALLASADWMYAYSDDAQVWYNGCKHFTKLYSLQKKIDVNGDIWNMYRPPFKEAPRHFVPRD